MVLTIAPTPTPVRASMPVPKLLRNFVAPLVSVAVIFFGAVAMSLPHDGCLAVQIQYLGGDTDYTHKCEKIESPTIGQTLRVYPLLQNNPYNVRFWEGSVGKPIVTKRRYLRIVSNQCTGRELLRSQFEVTDTDRVRFYLDNPNLSEKVSATDDLAPMSGQDAAVAYQELLSKCQTYRPAE